jgi:hypothetical protein
MCTRPDITVSVRSIFPLKLHIYIVFNTFIIAVVPVTVVSNSTTDSTDVPFHPTYSGKILFQNVFKGELPATDYPKVNVSHITLVSIDPVLTTV